jgi:hypothetical protein
MQKLENLKTIRHRRSQLEVKLFTEKLKNEGTGTIRLRASLRSFFFLFSSIAAFSAFHRSKKKKKTSFDE